MSELPHAQASRRQGSLIGLLIIMTRRPGSKIWARTGRQADLVPRAPGSYPEAARLPVVAPGPGQCV
jgi:hypothetical protein